MCKFCPTLSKSQQFLKSLSHHLEVMQRGVVYTTTQLQLKYIANHSGDVIFIVFELIVQHIFECYQGSKVHEATEQASSGPQQLFRVLSCQKPAKKIPDSLWLKQTFKITMQLLEQSSTEEGQTSVKPHNTCSQVNSDVCMYIVIKPSRPPPSPVPILHSSSLSQSFYFITVTFASC